MGEAADERYMRLALRLARRAEGRTSPNPMVGAVLVRADEIVATGYHRRAGTDHAEIVALRRAGERARGATLYLNFEPCDHFGRTPPCTRALIEAGVRRVVAGMLDPNPLVSGRGVRRLRRAGIAVEVGLLERECRRLNEAFAKFITRGIPFVILKLAASLDGKIATRTGHSRWITGEPARRYVHRMRNRVDAVIVGLETVRMDDPELTCRIRGGRDPWRIVLDRRLRVPLQAKLVRQNRGRKTVIVAGDAPARRRAALERLGVEVWELPEREGRISLGALLGRLAKLGCLSVMVEGGAATAAAFLAEKKVDKICFFYAPKLIGGDGKEMVGPLGIARVGQARALHDVEVRRLGEDLVVSGYL
jgi:diaminohydroxyphosphoribosylaminopyrimidine deaminase/5-amino-6-(5-phosphoribosylamino)uracil reductase